MAVKPLTPIVLEALGSKGLNTQAQDSTLGPEWLTEATNVVYDFQGRITSRKGMKQTSNDDLASACKSIGEFIKSDRTNEYYCGSGAGIYKADFSVTPTTLTLQTFSGTPQTIIDSNWQWENFNDEFWGTQRGHTPINFDGTNWFDITDLGTYAAPVGVTTFDPSCCLGHFGRMWYGGITEDKGVVYYSDNLIGEDLNGGVAGVIDLKTVWGNDEVVGLASLMDKLIIFGKNNIAIYGGASDPSTMALDELVKGVGLAGRDNISYVSSEVLFLSYTGLQSLSRITQTDGKAPLTELSIAVRSTLAPILSTTDLDTVKSAYFQEDGIVATFFPSRDLVYVFDFASSPQLGLPRITTWETTNTPYCGIGSLDGDFHLGFVDSVGLYDGYQDVTVASAVTTEVDYEYTWATSWLDLGSPTFSKILKSGVFTILGGYGATTNVVVYKDYVTATQLSKTFYTHQRWCYVLMGQSYITFW